MQQLKLLTCCALLLSLPALTDAQILNKIKQKAQQAADKVIDKKVDDAVNNQTNNPNAQNNNNNNNANNTSVPGASNKSRPTNKGGQGLITTPPNVNENLASADAAFKGGKYSDARYSVQQAMLGVEMEIGKQILAGLPESVSGLKKDPSSDQVTSTGWGWAGLTIKRDYNQDDKQLSFTIANNATWMQAINVFFNNGGYMQTSGNEQKWKQTKIQDQRAVIEYDQSSGYKLSVPLGQTSLLVYEGINFANEQDFMNAANQINIEQIKKQLGEK